jgi:hypothetical protein
MDVDGCSLWSVEGKKNVSSHIATTTTDLSVTELENNFIGQEDSHESAQIQTVKTLR